MLFRFFFFFVLHYKVLLCVSVLVSTGHQVFDVWFQRSTCQFRSFVPRYKKNKAEKMENNPDSKYVQSSGCQRKEEKKKKKTKVLCLLSARHSRWLSWDVMSWSCDGEAASRLESGVAFQVAHLLFRAPMRKSESARLGALAPESTLAC